jgi:hypothetical protein
MLTTSRSTVSLMAVLAVTLLGADAAMAAGGFFPNLPPGFVLQTSRDVTATIVLDPNGPVSSGAPLTPTGTFGTITIDRKKFGSASAVFRVEGQSSLGELARGCDLSLTSSRFVNLTNTQVGMPIGGPDAGDGNWLASDVTTALFNHVGVTLTDPATLTVLMVPGITGVISQECAPFPSSYAGLSTNPGFLVLHVTIGFWALPTTVTPK